MPRPEWRDPAKEKHWRKLLREWRRSGMTGRGFCARNSLSEPCFYFWKHEIAKRDQEKSACTRATPRLSVSPRSAAAALPAFLPVKVAPAAPSDATLEVVTVGGRVLRVRAGFDADVLRQLLAVLEESSC